MKRVAIITFFVFMLEAIIHYNQGAKAENPTHHLEFPKGKNLARLTIWVLLFSFLNAQLIKGKTIQPQF